MNSADDTLTTWVSDFPVEEVERDLHRLQAEAAKIEREIRKRRQLLDARNLFLGLAEDRNGQVHMAGEVTPAQRGRQRIAQREARRRAIDQERERDTARQRVAAERRARQRAIAEKSVRRSGPAAPDAEQTASVDELMKELDSMTDKAAAQEVDNALGSTPVGTKNSVEVDSLSRADKIISFLRAHRGETWKLSEIRDRLVDAGEIEDDPQDTHGIQVTASRLFRTGRIERPMPGHYRLPADAEEADS